MTGKATRTFHRGERELQTRAGVRDKLEQIGQRAIRDFMPDQHRAFFAQLPFLVAGTLDADGQPWATMLTGPTGFAYSPDPRRLWIAARAAEEDPAAPGIMLGAQIGLLGIELHTRRRNRMNGSITALEEAALEVTVEQSFGNCPQYIQLRELEVAPSWVAPPPARILDELDDDSAERVALADTFFIASAAAGGVDVSHRGGDPGFVRVDGRTLTWTDYRGNFFFNTLGNLLVNPRAGLLFVHFERGDVWQIAGRAAVIEGTVRREVRFHIEQVVHRPAAIPLRWQPRERLSAFRGVYA